MASPQGSQKFGSELFIRSYDHDPGGTSATITSTDGGTTLSYLDMSLYSHFGVNVKPSVLAGSGVTKVEIVASAATSFSSVTVIKDSGTVAADAIQDNVFQECSAEEIAQEGSDAGVALRYVAARITCQNAGDEAVVTYIAKPRFPRLDLTTNYIT